jgi:hypothetical protein
MYRTSSHIDLFNFHDSPVQAVESSGNDVQLSLAFAHIGASHPANRLGEAQCIKPCLVTFHEVSSRSAQVWSEEERAFRPHPEPLTPIRDDIMEFEASETAGGWSIKLTGFHAAGWAEWTLLCSSISIAWSEFAGMAWYES